MSKDEIERLRAKIVEDHATPTPMYTIAYKIKSGGGA